MKNTPDKRHKTSGFTLIELMVVVAIIGVLASIAIPKFADLVTRAKESAVKGQLGGLRSAINIYYADQASGRYPGVETINGALYDNLVPKYLGKVPPVTVPAVTVQGNPGHPTCSESTNPFQAGLICETDYLCGGACNLPFTNSTADVTAILSGHANWGYITDSSGNSGVQLGIVFVDSVYLDSGGNPWTNN